MYTPINNNNNYTDISIVFDRFYILNTSKKNSTPRKILADIEYIIKYDLRYFKENGLKSDRLETLNTLKDVVVGIKDRYIEKTAKSCQLAKWIFSVPEKQSEIECLIKRIDRLILPSNILSPLPDETIQYMGMFLTLGDLHRLAQSSHDGRRHALSSILSYASECGYKGQNYPELANCMNKILQVLPTQSPIPELRDHCYTVRENDGLFVRRPLGEILKNLSSITHEGLFNIFSAPDGCMHRLGRLGNHSPLPNDSFVNYLVNIHTRCINIQQSGQAIKNKANLALHEAIFGDRRGFPFSMTGSQMDVLKFLLKNGISPNTLYQDTGKRYFDLCVETGRIDFVQLFVQYRADLNYQGRTTGFTALHWACTTEALGHRDAFINRLDIITYENIIKLLLQNGANPNLAAINGDRPIHLIVNNNIVQGSNSHFDICLIISILKHYGTDINSQGNNGYTALHLACRRPTIHPETIKLLLSYRANPNIAATDNDYPIHSLVKRDNLTCPIIKLLIESSADTINKRGNNGYTALHLACLKSVYHNDTIKFLLSHRANPNIADNHGDCPIHLILNSSGNICEIIGTLLQFGADINRQGNNGRTILHLVCRKPIHSPDIIKFLLSHGADPSIGDTNGDRPIHSIMNNIVTNSNSHNNICQIIDALIQSGADINRQGNNGDTILHLACRRPGDHRNTIKFLLSHGANPNIANYQAELPIIPEMSI